MFTQTNELPNRRFTYFSGPEYMLNARRETSICTFLDP